ncbi:hypothetical protein CPY51_15785 [Rhizobium tubonense]|uniref:Uncharacterized protein n=1 Tax=Rhizobium tubonense TaxID=484088 RepID=A0A2W4CRK6_9HYPH|nr:hypothetical protein CPY51_15785 [Rhizobium tubonense]
MAVARREVFSFWTYINVGARIVPELLGQEGFCNAGALEPLLHPTIGLNPRSGKLHIHVMRDQNVLSTCITCIHQQSVRQFAQALFNLPHRSR